MMDFARLAGAIDTAQTEDIRRDGLDFNREIWDELIEVDRMTWKRQTLQPEEPD